MEKSSKNKRIAESHNAGGVSATHSKRVSDCGANGGEICENDALEARGDAADLPSSTSSQSVIRFGGQQQNGRFEEMEWQLSRRLPPRFRTAKNDVYITKKTKVAAQFGKCKMLLDTKCDAIIIHALGHAIGRAMSLALMLEDAMLHSVKVDVLTSSVQVTDDLLSLLDADVGESRQRTVSAVHILVARI